MKIHLQILELDLFHKFKSTFMVAWTNQTRAIYRLDQQHPIIIMDTKCNSTVPLGLVLGAYGVRECEGQDIYHPVGTVMIDMSKVPVEKPHTISTFLMDATCPSPKMGEIHCIITWKPTIIPPAVPNMLELTKKMHHASEKNLDYIYPWGAHGHQPTHPALTRIHSPYYTCNTGITMPSGAFLLELGTSVPTDKCIESHLERLRCALKMCGLKRSNFLKYAELVEKGECDSEINNALIVLARTLTMHTNQVMKYVSDIQFNGKNTVSTDRWECPRDFDFNYVGDCEDCAKEIMVEIHEWQNMKSDNELVVAVQKLLKNYVPVAIQGCVAQNGVMKNHIWASLIPDPTFLQSMGRGDYGFKTSSDVKEKYALPTILLEGTAETHPLLILKKNADKMNQDAEELCRLEPIFESVGMYDIEPHNFYKYVIAAMTPRWKDHGYLDYVYINKSMRGFNTYGIPFEKWMSGRYFMVPATKHSDQAIKMMEHLCSYDRPITPLSYNTQIISSVGKPSKNMYENNISFGYRMKNRRDPFHLQVCDAVERLNKQGYEIFGNIIDHEACYWVDWVFERKKIEHGDRPLPDLFLL